MNSKMTTNSQLSTTEPQKQKLSKEVEQEQNTEMEITWRVIGGEGEGKKEEKGTGNKKHNLYVQNRQGEVKNSVGNGEAKSTYMYDPWT